MKEGTVKAIQVTANVAIIVTAVLLCAVLIKNYIIVKPVLLDVNSRNQISRANQPARPQGQSQIQPGVKLSLTGIDWAKNGKTLLLAVSNTCHFCSESAPFYQRLSHGQRGTRLVAVLPQTVEEGRSYLDKLNVAVDEIKQAPLPSFGITGTPTLVLVDHNGMAVKSWVGKLGSDREAEVIASVQ